MTNTENESTILKTDTRGRVVTPPARRQELLDEFDRSGLSGAKFAALAGIKYPTLASWLQARRRQSVGSPQSTPPHDPLPRMRWLEAVVDQAQGEANGAVRVRLPNGLSVELAQAAHVPLAAALVRALAMPAPAC